MRVQKIILCLLLVAWCVAARGQDTIRSHDIDKVSADRRGVMKNVDSLRLERPRQFLEFFCKVVNLLLIILYL